MSQHKLLVLYVVCNLAVMQIAVLRDDTKVVDTLAVMEVDIPLGVIGIGLGVCPHMGFEALEVEVDMVVDGGMRELHDGKVNPLNYYLVEFLERFYRDAVFALLQIWEVVVGTDNAIHWASMDRLGLLRLFVGLRYFHLPVYWHKYNML